MNNRMLLNVYDKENGDHDLIACDIITCVLELPGVKEAVMIQALEHFGTSELRELANDFGNVPLSDIPFQYAWDYIFNQED